MIAVPKILKFLENLGLKARVENTIPPTYILSIGCKFASLYMYSSTVVLIKKQYTKPKLNKAYFNFEKDNTLLSKENTYLFQI